MDAGWTICDARHVHAIIEDVIVLIHKSRFQFLNLREANGRIICAIIYHYSSQADTNCVISVAEGGLLSLRQ